MIGPDLPLTYLDDDDDDDDMCLLQLLKTLPVLQSQVDALLEFDVSPHSKHIPVLQMSYAKT